MQSLNHILEPWTIKKWKKVKGKINSRIQLTDSRRKGQSSNDKVFNGIVYFLEKDKNSVKIEIDEAKKWVTSTEPTIIFTNTGDGCVYLLISEHYVNSLFSENPSWTANDSVFIPVSKFTALTKAKKKEIQAFVHNWKKINFTILKSGIYFEIKDSLKEVISKAIMEIDKLGIPISLKMLGEIEESINRAIYTVAIVGPTKAGKSTIINSLVSKYVSPINIRPTTGIPTNIVPGHEERAEILFKDGTVISGNGDESFINQYVSIDKNKGNYKDVKMVTVWVRSSQMEKGLSFCDFPGLDDPDEEIEKTVTNALRFVNAIIYVIDASGMQNGFKFPRQYRDDLRALKDKDRIFLVVNKIDDFNDPKILEQFKAFIDEQLDDLDIKQFLPYPPIYMNAKKSFEARVGGLHRPNDEMTNLESQVWDHLLANSKSGMHNLMNIITEVGTETERSIRILNTRKIQGEKRTELTNSLETIKKELTGTRNFEGSERAEVKEWLSTILEDKKKFLINHYEEYLRSIDLNHRLPNDKETQKYLIDEFSITAPDYFELVEDKITDLNNRLNSWVSTKLKIAEVSIDKYSKNRFKNSEAFNQLLQPITNIFSESYGKSVPTGMWSNIFYHITNALDIFGDVLFEIFNDKATVKKRKMEQIMKKIKICYDELFTNIYITFSKYIDQKCKEMVGKIIDRTNIYLADLQKQLSELNNPLNEGELKIQNLAIEKLTDLDTQCANIKLQIEEYNTLLKPKLSDELVILDKQVDCIEKQLRSSINDILTKNLGTTVAKKIIPNHLHSKIDDRVGKLTRDHPDLDEDDYKELVSTLQFLDIPDYSSIILNGSYWQYFESIYKHKENFNKHVIQLSNLRNALKHGRDITELVIAEGKASVIWFNSALKIGVQ